MKYYLFIILVFVGWIIYTRQQHYKERFQTRKAPLSEQELTKKLCRFGEWEGIKSKIRQLEVELNTPSFVFTPEHTKGMINHISIVPAENIIKEFPQLESDFRIIRTMRDSFWKFAETKKWYALPENVSASEFDSKSRIFIRELIDSLNILVKKYDCYGYIEFEYNTLMQYLKQLQGLCMKETITKVDKELFTKYGNQITELINTAKGEKADALTDAFKKDFITLFLNKEYPILEESIFKRKGNAKKIGKWITFLEIKKKPVKGYDYNMLNSSKNNSKQSPQVSYLKPLTIVSAGTFNAEQEQTNIPEFDIKDNGGFNLFRAVVTKNDKDIPVVTNSYSIKESCMKERDGIPLEMGNTPLILKNFARDSNANNNRYDASQYFGYPKLYIIENIEESGKNLNGNPITYYLSYSGNTTEKDGKPLYHIRALNPISGEFDYAYDVGTTDSFLNVSLKVGRLDSSLDTSLFTIEPAANENSIALLNYGFRGFGKNSGKNHYFYQKFDKSGRNYENLKPITEDQAKIWKLNKITV